MLNIGDTVKVHYTGKFEDGTVFDTTVTSGPIVFTIGDEMMIPGFEKAVMQMNPGDSKTIKLAPREAYGDYDPSLIYVVRKSEYFPDREIHRGDQIQVPVEDGVVPFTVIEVQGEEIKLDGNSELAGKTVVFDIELIEIVSQGDGFGFEEDFDDEFKSEFDDSVSLDDIEGMY